MESTIAWKSFNDKPAWVAQSDERLIGDQVIAGSIPAGSGNIEIS